MILCILRGIALVQGFCMRFIPDAPEQPGAEAGPVPNRVAQPSSSKFG